MFNSHLIVVMVDMGKEASAKSRKSLRGKKSLGGDSSDVVVSTPKKQNENKPNGNTPKSAAKKNKRKSVAGPLDTPAKSDNSESLPKKQKPEKSGEAPVNTDGAKKKADKVKARRKEKRKECYEKIGQLKSGGSVDSTYLEKITKKIAELEQRPEKTSTSKKKLRKFRYYEVFLFNIYVLFFDFEIFYYII